MRHLYRNSFLLAAILIVSVLAIYPPGEKLRKGRDLAGGTSLVYSISIEPGEPADEIINNTIEVLKKRVDPNGLYEIAFVRQGADRIEITMPLPTDRVKQLKTEFEAALAELDAYRIDANRLERVMRMPAEERDAALREMAGQSELRTELFLSAARAYDAYQDARREYEEASAAGADPRALDALIERAGEARDSYDNARDAAIRTSFDSAALARALELSSASRNILNRETDSVETLPSAREDALARIRQQNPTLVDQIDRVIAAYDVFAAERRGLDDANDLIRMLRGSGVLDFRIAVQPGDIDNLAPILESFYERGPRASVNPEVRWFPVNNIDSWYDDIQTQRLLAADPAAFFQMRGYVGAERDGQYYMLLWDTMGMRLTRAEAPWGLSAAYRTPDPQSGMPAIGFEMDSEGATKLGRMTGENVGKPMAILLDDQVYSAPNLNSRISSRGIIVGRFTDRDIRYIVDTLSAGSLAAKLSDDPISTSTLAARLGADNLQRGFIAGVIALFAVAAFMMVYYMGAGFVAVFALACNALMILGVMALARAAFTLPGIAGIILTFGMAVDANVLIYERIREELDNGADIKSAVRLGYQKVLSTILDANITNLIVCLVLYNFATQEIRGFAITLSIGVICTLISSLFITRLIFALMIEKTGGGFLRHQLPTVVPALNRVLNPTVNWLKLRPLFLVISAGYLTLGFGMIFYQGEKMFDNEFRGGISVDVTLEEGQTRTRQDIADLIIGAVAELPADSTVLDLRTAEVVAINPRADGVTSDMFRIKTVATDRDGVSDTILRALGGLVATSPPLGFVGADAPSFREAPVYPILDRSLGANIGRPGVRDDVGDYLGGAAIVFEDLQPRPTIDSLRERIQDMRRQPDFSATLARGWDVLILDGTESAVRSAVMIVRDPELGFLDDETRWRIDVAEREWELASGALTRTTTFAGVQSFSPQVAATFRAQAIVAVLLSFMGILAYVWFRFGSLRYSMAAIVALLHDVIAVIGLIAVAEILYDKFPGVAAALLIEPFKIDLGLIAAILTIIGYSLNDTIVILDRIRENRGKLPLASAEVINRSINQTMSRTIITSGTTLLAVLIMYVVGGVGIRSFTYALLCGVVLGTFSTVAIAAPMVYSSKIRPGGGGGTGSRHDSDESTEKPALTAA